MLTTETNDNAIAAPAIAVLAGSAEVTGNFSEGLPNHLTGGIRDI
jgi:hypothetical protein